MPSEATYRERQRQEMRASQKQIDQSTLLEMNINTLLDNIENTVEANPALEKVPEEPDDTLMPPDDGGDDSERSRDDEADSVTFDEMQPDEYGDEVAAREILTRRSRTTADGDTLYESEPVSVDTLGAHLNAQLADCDFDDTQRLIAEYIIGSLDSDGYLRDPNGRPIAAAMICDDLQLDQGLNVTVEQVQTVLDIIRAQFEPAGVVAADLRDCLLLQIERKKGRDAMLAYRIVQDYLDDLAARRYEAIAAALGVDSDTVKRVLAGVIQSLDPKPGSSFVPAKADDRPMQITPDFRVEVEGDTVTLTLNNRIPELTISTSYKTAMTRATAAARGKNNPATVMRDDYTRARDYLDMLKNRQETLYACMSEVCNRQHDYFVSGDTAALKPLTQQNIADAIGRDVTVVSRALANKYADTPWGIKPLKFYLSEGINGVATRTIKDALLQIIEQEDKSNPYNDKQLSDLLKQRGYHVERRTVAKYRAEAAIPGSSQRKSAG